MRALLLIFLTVVTAGPEARAADASERERNEFRRLYVAAQSGRADETDFLLLRSYPLYPYLLSARLAFDIKHQQGDRTDARMTAFLDEYSDVASAEPLRQRWVLSLAERQRWATVLAHAPAETKDAELACVRLRAAIALGKTTGVVAAAQGLWKVGTAQHKACDPVFAWLAEQRELPPVLILERAQLAQEVAETRLVTQLAARLANPQRARLERWVLMMRDTQAAAEQLARQRDPLLDARDVRLLLERFARRDTKRAGELHPLLAANGSLNPEEAARAAAFIGYVHLSSREPEGHAFFERAGTAELDEKLGDWRVRSALFMQDWAAVLAWIDLMPKAQREDERWRYWRARAQETLGDAGGKQRARAEFMALAASRSYFGYLAADRVNAGYAFNDRPEKPDPAIQAKLAQNPILQRARELWLLDDFDWQARSEWRQLNRKLNAEYLQQAALLADEWGWHSEAILSIQAANAWNALAVRFPLAYQPIVGPIAKMRGLDSAWVYGLMRSESLFIAGVRSPANAWGLMQLLPTTARKTAGKIGLAWKGIPGLQQPEYNVRLGTAYLKEMQDRFGGLQVLATAAYNAGPNAVQRWLPKRPTEGALWAEIIPYNETHKYVRTVLENTAAFESRLQGGKAQRLTHRLGTILPASQLPLD